MPRTCVITQNYDHSTSQTLFNSPRNELFEETSQDEPRPPTLVRSSQVISEIARYLLDDFDCEVTPKFRVVGPLANVLGNEWKCEDFWPAQVTPQVPFPLQ